MKWENNKLTNSDENLIAEVKFFKGTWCSDEKWSGEIWIYSNPCMGMFFKTEKEAKSKVEIVVKDLIKKFNKLGK